MTTLVPEGLGQELYSSGDRPRGSSGSITCINHVLQDMIDDRERSHNRVYAGRTNVSMGFKERIESLAKPKLSRSNLSYGPSLAWGNQQTMWELSKGALTAEPSDRLLTLSQPKKKFSTQEDLKPQWEYSCGRQSPIIKPSPAARVTEANDRLATLATPKYLPSVYSENRAMYEFSCGRSSPIQEPSPAAKVAGTGAHTESLAQPKKVHQNYAPSNEVQTVISEAAKNGRPSERIESLAEAKKRPTGPFREPEWPVSNKARKAQVSERVRELARSKGLVEGFQGNRDVAWNTTKAAKQAVATRRIEELSAPIQRASMDHVQFNPDVFKVSEAAKKGKPSARTEELAIPNIRK